MRKAGVVKEDLDPTASQIAGALEEEIALGYLRPRERLVEEELAERFSVKRHVVRQALSELDAMGVIVRQPNRGAAVRDFSAVEVEELWLVRTLVEGCAAKLIPLPAPAALIEKLQSIQAKHSAAVERGDLRRVFRENVRFHRALFSACGNGVLMELIEDLAFKAHAVRSYAILDPQLLASARDEHLRIIGLLRGTDRKVFVDLLKGHIQPAKSAYLRVTKHRPFVLVDRDGGHAR